MMHFYNFNTFMILLSKRLNTAGVPLFPCTSIYGGATDFFPPVLFRTSTSPTDFLL